MTKLTHSTRIQAAVEGVFAFLLDPERLAAANPATHELVEAAPPPAEVGSTFTWPYRMMGMPLEATLEYTDITPGRRVVLESSKGFVFRFSVEPADSGTKLTIDVEDLPATWVEAAVDSVAMKLTEHDLDTWLANIKTELETGVPTHHEQEPVTVTRTITIKAPAERVYAFLADPENAFGSYPGTSVTDVTITPEVAGTSCRWQAHILGIPVSVVVEYTAAVPAEHLAARSATGFVTTWMLDPVEGGTKLTLTQEAEPSSWFGDALRSVILRMEQRDQAGEDWLERIAAAVESRSGA